MREAARVASSSWRDLIHRGALTLACLAIAQGGCGSRYSSTPRPELWFYETVNLNDDEAVDHALKLWSRAIEAGYSRVVLADEKFARLGEMNAGYYENALTLRRAADSLGLDVIPGVFQVGRSGPMLAADPDLVESLPVENAVFEVHGGVAQPVTEPRVEFPDRPTGHDFEARVTGHRISMGRVWWRGRWWYDLPVQPHRSYDISVSIRTSGFKGKPLIQVVSGGRVINFIRRFGVEADQDWTVHHVMFNSLEHSSVRVYMGVWRRTRGEIEWRDWTIAESGPVNIVRRADLPLTAINAATGDTLLEGRDFESVVDTLMGNDPWRGQFRRWHAPPVIRTPLPDGARIRMSWSQAAIVEDKQATVCLSEPKTYAMLADEAHRLRELWGPGRFAMMFDEIRALGRDAPCLRRGETPGRILADAVRRCASYLPDDTLYVWGDMFDPYQNAVADFYLVGGDLAGSWEGLDRRVRILNWNGGAPRKSLMFFAGRGHQQVVSGYYDGPPGQIKSWLQAARGVPGIEAVMYTTWEDQYDDLETFAHLVRSGWR